MAALYICTEAAFLIFQMIIKDKEFELYLKSASITRKVKDMAAKITEDYKDKDPMFIPTLNGDFIFAADLVREIDIDAQTSFIKMASYDEMTSTGNIKELIGLGETIFGRHVILIEDIIDTGNTILQLLEKLNELGPKSLEVASLLIKEDKGALKIKPKYVGFEIPDKFIVGYGMDYDGYGRNTKDIFVIKDQ